MNPHHHAAPLNSAPQREKGAIKSLRQLAPYLRPYRLLVMGAILALLFTASAMLGMGAALRFLVDYGISQGNPNLLDSGFALLLGVVGLLAAAAFARFYLVSSLGEKLVRDIRRDVFARVMAMDMPYFESTATGELLSRLTADTQLLQVVLTGTLSTAIRNGLMLMGGLLMLMLTSGKLTAMVLLMIPLVILPIIVLGKKVRYWSREVQSRLAQSNSETEETLYGIHTVQAFSLETYRQERFNDSLDGILTAAMTRIRLRSWLTAIVIGLVFGGIMTVLWMGARDVLAGNISTGELSAFVFYAVVVAGATGALSDIIGELQRAAGAAERVLELLANRPVIASPEHPLTIPQPLQGELTFAGVQFHYPSRPDQAALENLTLTLAAGEMVALVGPSGAGKTTLLQLLQRFYDPQQGHIVLDGVDIRRFTLHDLRRTMAVVPQDAVMFSTTIAENIRYGEIHASEAQIRHAAEQAAALEFIEKLPDGFQSYVGEKGIRLSGGQKQRIAIARALIRNPRILLLDEATSALDAESERLVQVALNNATAQRTTLVIAHRLATVKKANRIVVLNEGKIEAIGSHLELLESSPLYARLAQLQFMG
jgi:ATP-binding cassette subfamily B protein